MMFPHEEYQKRLRGMDESSLRCIIVDATEAMTVNPDAEKSRNGWYADEVNYAGMELKRRADAKTARNAKSRARRAAMSDVLDGLGMKRVRGAMGGTYYE